MPPSSTEGHGKTWTGRWTWTCGQRAARREDGGGPGAGGPEWGRGAGARGGEGRAPAAAGRRPPHRAPKPEGKKAKVGSHAKAFSTVSENKTGRKGRRGKADFPTQAHPRDRQLPRAQALPEVTPAPRRAEGRSCQLDSDTSSSRKQIKQTNEQSCFFFFFSPDKN